MKNSHDNLVGKVIRKDIYIIKNTVNNKVYIGQATDTYQRWKAHKTAAKTGHYKNKSVLYEAMREHGITNFYYEILEKQVENYNEREKYWIKFYNSTVPNGYNILDGGAQYPNWSGIENPASAIQSIDVLNSVINDLKYSELLLTEIAQKYKIPLNTVHGVNTGSTYFNSNMDYPIRKENKWYKLSGENVQKLKKDLQYSSLTVKELAEKYGVSDVTIRNVNNGDFYSDEGREYPIRKEKKLKSRILSDKQVDEIINLLQNTSLSYRNIARRYGVVHSVIICIKNGTKIYRRKNLSYPLRPNN